MPGATAMIGVDHLMDIRDLARQGHSVRAIARITGLSRNTVRKVLRGAHDLKRKEPPRPSKLDPFKDYLRGRRAEHPLSAVRLLEEIRPMGYEGSVITPRRFLAGLDDRARREGKLTVRFETPPGRQAQADWAHAGRLVDAAGRPRPVYVFTFVLSYSRMLFIRFTTSVNLAALVDCHQRAFDYLGGWPQSILYDNMKQVRLGPGRWNEAFLDFAAHYGFTPKAHRPYRPRTKGKVERAVDYVKDGFLLGRTFADLDDLNAQGLAWLAETANVRVHATTGRRPVDLLPLEGLTPASGVPAYRYLDPVRRVVSFEAMVHYRGGRYSVPPAFAGRPVEVAAAGGQIVIRAGEAVIAEHREAAQPGQCIAARDHIAELWRITHEQVAKPPRPGPLAAAAPEVQRVDLRTYEEVRP
jgi:transposase